MSDTAHPDDVRVTSLVRRAQIADELHRQCRDADAGHPETRAPMVRRKGFDARAEARRLVMRDS